MNKISNNHPLISIIVPVFNEAKIINISLPPIFNLDLDKEVIVVEDGSHDQTQIILQELKKQYNFTLIIQNPNQGKGEAVKKGFNMAQGKYLIVCDADLEYNPLDIELLLKKAEEKNDDKLAIYGSRFKGRLIFSWHYLVNKFLTELTNFLFRGNLTDMETCFKLIPKHALVDINLSGGRFEIEPEITARLLKSSYKIEEIPINYNRRSFKEGKKITAKDGFLAVKKLFQEKFITKTNK